MDKVKPRKDSRAGSESDCKSEIMVWLNKIPVTSVRTMGTSMVVNHLWRISWTLWYPFKVVKSRLRMVVLREVITDRPQ